MHYHAEFGRFRFRCVFNVLTLIQIKQVWREAPIEAGQLDYLKFVHIMKRGADDE